MDLLPDCFFVTVKQEEDENRLLIKDEVKTESEFIVSEDGDGCDYELDLEDEVKTESKFILSKDENAGGDGCDYELDLEASNNKNITMDKRPGIFGRRGGDSGGGKSDDIKIRRIGKLEGRLIKKKRKIIFDERAQATGTMNTCQESNRFYCNICHESFSFKCNLIRHKNRAHSARWEVFKCNKCGKTFKNLDSLKAHGKRTKKKGIKCDICDYISYKLSHFKRHLAYKHTNNHRKDIVCETCKKSFTTTYHLYDHKRRHKSKNGLRGYYKNFICDICNKEFPSKKDITDHINMHMGMKEFVCLTCKRAFVTKSHLLRHERSKYHKNRVTS